MNPESNSVALSIVIPAKNESAAIGDVVRTAKSEYPDAEITVVDDGSTDATASYCKDHIVYGSPGRFCRLSRRSN